MSSVFWANELLSDNPGNEILTLASGSGLLTNHGIIVDPWMRTSDPYILAVGSIVEFDRRGFPNNFLITNQIEMVARCAIAGPYDSLGAFAAIPPVTHLYIAEHDVLSIGYLYPQGKEEEEIVIEENEFARYRKLVIANGKIIGAILVNYPQFAIQIIMAIKLQIDITCLIEALRMGKWELLCQN